MSTDEATSPEELQAAVRFRRAALAATAEDDIHRASCLMELGTALRNLFERTGRLADLEECVRLCRAAVSMADSDEDLSRAGCLDALATALQFQFERTGRLDLLDEAIRNRRAALDAARADGSDHVTHLANLGTTLMTLFTRSEQMSVLDDAICAFRGAVAAAGDDHPFRGGCLTRLGHALRVQFERTGRAAVLEESLQLVRAAVAAAPEGDPERATNLAQLGVALQELFWRTRRQEVLDEAVRTYRAAIAATPHDHPSRTDYLNALAIALQTLSQHTGDERLLDEARRCCLEAANNTSAALDIRIIAYRRFAELPGGEARDKLAAMEAVIDLMGTFAPGDLARTDRQFRLGELGQTASQAAAAAVAAGRPAYAVELLERARGILSSEVRELRGQNLAALREYDVRAGTTWTRLVEQSSAALHALDQASAAPSGSSPASGPASDDPQSGGEFRRLAAGRAAAETAQRRLFDEIRALPGLEAFSGPPTVGALAHDAGGGPIVFVTITGHHVDALILTDAPDPVHAVPLTGVTLDDLTRHCGHLLFANRFAAPDFSPLVVLPPDVVQRFGPMVFANMEAVDDIARPSPAGRPADARDLNAPSSGSDQEDIQAALAWLWDAIAEPVLTHLGHTRTPVGDAPWPRVWWCPVGIAASLPLHAAGRHNEPPGPDGTRPTVLDRVVSSYTPTARALAHARTRRSTHGPANTLIVSVPGIPGAPLAGVTAESKAIRALIPAARLLPRPVTRAAVLAALPAHRIAHFACHGHADGADPAASRLLLDDHATVPFTLADITALDLDADLAYLSACDTARTTPKLTDELLNLAAALHLAGYRHVIGTLWPVGDTAAAEIAESFYAHLTRHGTCAPDADQAAYALHHAIRRQRDRNPHAPTDWASHTHTGV
jgi:CHAT domain/Tetratricopeptide repeat